MVTRGLVGFQSGQANRLSLSCGLGRLRPIISLASLAENVEPSKPEKINDDDQLRSQLEYHVGISVFGLGLVSHGKRGRGHGQLKYSSHSAAFGLGHGLGRLSQRTPGDVVEAI